MKTHIWMYNDTESAIISLIEKSYGGLLRYDAQGFYVTYHNEEVKVLVVQSRHELTSDFLKKTSGIIAHRLVFMNWCSSEELRRLLQTTRVSENPTYFIGCNDWWPEDVKESAKNWLIEEK